MPKIYGISDKFIDYRRGIGRFARIGDVGVTLLSEKPTLLPAFRWVICRGAIVSLRGSSCNRNLLHGNTVCGFYPDKVNPSFLSTEIPSTLPSKTIILAISERIVYFCSRIPNFKRHDKISHRLTELQENP